MGEEVRKKIIAWDVAPDESYFKELRRVSRQQIIWGANYFAMPPSRNFVVWDKKNIGDTFSMAMCEYASVSIPGNAKIIRCVPQGNAGNKRFHPTQKPVELYRKLLEWYAKPGWKILDTHLGSGSSRIAAYDAGLDFIGFEVDPEYYRKQEERFEAYTAQLDLFHL